MQRDNLDGLAANSGSANNTPQLFKKETVDLEKIFLDEKNEFGRKHEEDTLGGIMKYSGKESSKQAALDPTIGRFDTTESAKKLSK